MQLSLAMFSRQITINYVVSSRCGLLVEINALDVRTKLRVDPGCVRLFGVWIDTLVIAICVDGREISIL